MPNGSSTTTSTTTTTTTAAPSSTTTSTTTTTTTLAPRSSSGWYGPASGGCDCCSPCVLFSDDFERASDTDVGSDWTEVVGDWRINADARLTPNGGTESGTNAVIMMAENDPSIYGGGIIEVTIHGNQGDKPRVILWRTDADNYSYLEIELSGGAGGLDRLEYHQVWAGVDNTAWCAEYDVRSGGRLHICRTPYYVAVMKEGASGLEAISGYIYSSIGQGGSRPGLGTGDTAVAVEFDDFEVQIAGGDCPVCSQHDCNCFYDDSSFSGVSGAYDEWKVDLGVGGWTDFYSTTCCTSISGEYCMTYCPGPDSQAGEVAQCAADSTFCKCFWSTNVIELCAGWGGYPFLYQYLRACLSIISHQNGPWGYPDGSWKLKLVVETWAGTSVMQMGTPNCRAVYYSEPVLCNHYCDALGGFDSTGKIALTKDTDACSSPTYLCRDALPNTIEIWRNMCSGSTTTTSTTTSTTSGTSTTSTTTTTTTAGPSTTTTTTTSTTTPCPGVCGWRCEYDAGTGIYNWEWIVDTCGSGCVCLADTCWECNASTYLSECYPSCTYVPP